VVRVLGFGVKGTTKQKRTTTRLKQNVIIILLLVAEDIHDALVKHEPEQVCTDIGGVVIHALGIHIEGVDDNLNQPAVRQIQCIPRHRTIASLPTLGRRVCKALADGAVRTTTVHNPLNLLGSSNLRHGVHDSIHGRTTLVILHDASEHIGLIQSRLGRNLHGTLQGTLEQGGVKDSRHLVRGAVYLRWANPLPFCVVAIRFEILPNTPPHGQKQD
jgi:hypothetical protein